MQHPCWLTHLARQAVFASLGIAALACGSTGSVDAPAPKPVADLTVDSLPMLPPSLVDAPITYDLTPALEKLEASVPRKFGDSWEFVYGPPR